MLLLDSSVEVSVDPLLAPVSSLSLVAADVEVFEELASVDVASEREPEERLVVLVLVSASLDDVRPDPDVLLALDVLEGLPVELTLLDSAVDAGKLLELLELGSVDCSASVPSLLHAALSATRTPGTNQKLLVNFDTL